MEKLGFFALLLIALLTSCATTEMMALNENIIISNISVAEEVVTPKDILFIGGGAAFGLLGAMADKSAAKQFQEFAVKNGIDIKDIVRNTFIRTLKTASKYSYYENSQYRINLEIKMYGVAKMSTFSDKYDPVLLLQARMTDETGKIIWKNGQNIYLSGAVKTIQPVSMKELKENPEILRKLWTDAAIAASKDIVKYL